MFLTFEEKHFKSAHTRFPKNIFDRFVKESVPSLGGVELRSLFVDKMLEIVDKYMPPLHSIKPGQMLWTAVSKDTRPDSKKVVYKPIILTLIEEKDINKLEKGEETLTKQFSSIIARLLKEAHSQGCLLSMRDLALIFKRPCPSISTIRIKYEMENNEILPTPSNIQDFGSGISHKVLILKKILLEKKEMSVVRRETKHSQSAIDRYLKDYRRVELLLNENKDIQFISKVTGMRKHLIIQYKSIFEEVKCLKK